MTEEVKVSTVICDQSQFGNNNCRKSVLYIPVKELSNLGYMKNEQNYNMDFAEVWGIAFFSVLFFYSLGRGVGSVLEFLKSSFR